MAVQSKKILIMEDEKPMAHALQLKLQHSGYTADVAYDGVEGLEKLKAGSYDIILMDLMMPKKDGWTVLEELHKEGNKVPVIVASNLSQEEDEKRARKLGAKDFIVKSNIQLTEIIERIKKI